MLATLLQTASSAASKGGGTTTQQAVGYVILFLAIVLLLVYIFTNIRRAKPELGSEVELAPNRKPYYTDPELEGKKLDRALHLALLSLGLIAIVIPLYWLHEPSRQANATRGFHNRFVDEGKAMFAPTAEGGFNCAGCHGGMKATGGSAAFTQTDADGRYIKTVKWQAPALDTVFLRYSWDEIRYILTYGRPFSPMPAWGLAGGGALDSQEIETLIAYLQSIQVTPQQAQQQVAQDLKLEKQSAQQAGQPYASDGQALFNLGYYSGAAGGAFSCGRCHTQGWSYQEKQLDGDGAFGPSLRGSTVHQFPGAVEGLTQQVQFVCSGSVEGKQYGIHGQGTGRMPAFCQTKAYDPENDPLASLPDVPKVDQGKPGSGMMTEADVQKIVEYERSLP